MQQQQQPRPINEQRRRELLQLFFRAPISRYTNNTGVEPSEDAHDENDAHEIEEAETGSNGDVGEQVMLSTEQQQEANALSKNQKKSRNRKRKRTDKQPHQQNNYTNHYNNHNHNNNNNHYHNHHSNNSHNHNNNHHGNGNKRQQRVKPLFTPTPLPVCKFYLEGKCTKGKDCAFRHEGTPKPKNDFCKFFLIDACAKGEDCPYSHVLSDFPCKHHFVRGACHRKPCVFSHDRDSILPERFERMMELERERTEEMQAKEQQEQEKQQQLLSLLQQQQQQQQKQQQQEMLIRQQLMENNNKNDNSGQQNIQEVQESENVEQVMNMEKEAARAAETEAAQRLKETILSTNTEISFGSIFGT